MDRPYLTVNGFFHGGLLPTILSASPLLSILPSALLLSHLHVNKQIMVILYVSEKTGSL